MAKSLRSKSKRAFRATKRTSSDSAFYIADSLRVNRLSEKLKKCAQQPKLGQEDSMDVEQSGPAEPSSSVDETEHKKVSTHGPRMSGREVWKASKRGVQLRRAPSTVVWHKRKAGKPQRRR